ncbi:MAG: GntR family transcriptional regulator [Thomasclavelia sp.]|jgi:GntR family transcriptional regulator|nr:GntR family transcriptional regulator [Thomasclavelia sp.]
MVKYIDIADDIRSKIYNKKYTYGQKLPYETALCLQYKCNKETMKKSLEILVKEGLIIRRRGAGTFVKDYDPLNEGIKSNTNAALGLTKRFEGISKVESEVITFEVIPTDELIGKKLQVEIGSFVYHIIRRRLVDKKPYSIEIIYMPISLVTNLTLDDIQNSLYEYIEKNLNLKIQSAHQTITSAISTQLEQDYLNLKKTEPYIQVEQVAYLSNGSIFEYSINRFDFKTFEFSTVTVK